MSKEMMGHFHDAHKKVKSGHPPAKSHTPPPHKPPPEVAAKGGPITTVGTGPKVAMSPMVVPSLPPMPPYLAKGKK